MDDESADEPAEPYNVWRHLIHSLFWLLFFALVAAVAIVWMVYCYPRAGHL